MATGEAVKIGIEPPAAASAEPGSTLGPHVPAEAALLTKAALWIAGWYLCAIGSNLALKTYLAARPLLVDVLFATWLASAVAAVPTALRIVRGGEAEGRGTIGVAVPSSVSARLRAEVSRDTMVVGGLHLVATALTNVSILVTTLAYAHTIKATEPIFTSILSRQLLSERLPWIAHAAIVVVVVGVALTSYSEAEPSVVGLAAALIANVASATRAVLFKRAYGHSSAAQAFGRMSLVATMLLTPILLLAMVVVPDLPLGAGVTPAPWTAYVAWMITVASVLNAGYFTCSFHVLTFMHAVSHALVNVMKRVAIIVTSMVLFHTPATTANMVGIAIANVGIGIYSVSLRWPGLGGSHHHHHNHHGSGAGPSGGPASATQIKV